ncbi:hypothetical protein BU24DRAFT_481795 [Aaosphaeria arxii CBS 175.79]|uniref:Serine hydrolase domain-containing protein n=1 Tax=Aaosphaeria arxii CBS 175.79 TaxID=1450172 RepID=A0A6A5XMI5_9PLEO|nr:uncharacterized protein BU24DRAFT_481795 [Aaosphaeria arxii CBS 175.79]KAF2014352.1 hypothetical protein BU24DRAFT_481795 [Aaosphaeria arxii CBS 175.79]
MRFLCLHGGGTNNRVYELQLAAIRHELGTEHSFEYVEGTIPSTHAAGIESLVTTDEEFFMYYPYDPSVSGVVEAVENLQTYIEEEGPFDGILAFSQACGLASTWSFWNPQVAQDAVRGIVFFSGDAAISVQGLREGRLEYPDVAVEGKGSMPSLHVWGANDTMNPDRNKILFSQWDEANATLLVHEGGHELPSAGMNSSVVEIAHQIRRLCG